jgi:SAM-dependent methyltransferase
MTRPDKPPSNPWTDDDVARHWDSVAAIYVDANSDVSAAHDQRFGWAIPELRLSPGCRVLNITSRDCGAHPHLLKICPSAQVTHAEISNGLIAVAAGLYPDARICKIDRYDKLPFESAAFDRILCLETLEHVSSPAGFLTELHRLVVPGGRMVLSCPPASCEWTYRLYTALFGGHGEGPHRFPSSREVKTWLAVTGWTLVRHEGTLLIPCGPRALRQWGERLLRRFPHSWLSELGIRQFFVCEKQEQRRRDPASEG